MAPRVRVDGFCLFLGAMGVLLVPARWLFGAVLAAFFHECCHMLAIYCCKGYVLGLRIGVGGAVIETSAMTPGKELICTIAGPAGSFLLLMLAKWAPEMALCALVQGVYNLFPVYPLDGGRAVHCVLNMLFPREADCISRWIECSFLILLAGIGIYFGIWPFMIVLVAASRAAFRKIPCKEGKQAVQ